MLLLKTAFRLSRAHSRRASVDAEAIRRAYLSPNYRVNREDVELLSRQAIEQRKLRDDLWCPFQSLGDQPTTTENDSTADHSDKVVPLTAAADAFERRAEAAMLVAAMTPGEARDYKTLDSGNTVPANSTRVVRFRGPKVTRENLQSGALALEALAKKPSASRSNPSKESRTASKDNETRE